MAAAMGMENAIFEQNGEVRFGLTYMTGALVKFGQWVAARLSGERAHDGAVYLLLWLGLVSGGVLGAIAYPHFGLGALWFTAALLAVAALIMLGSTGPARETHRP